MKGEELTPKQRWDRDYYRKHRDSILAKKRAKSEDPTEKDRKRVYNKNYQDRNCGRIKKQRAEHRRKNGKEISRRQVEWQRSHPDYVRYRNFKCKYGLTKEAYDDLVESQGNKCAICESPPDGRWGRLMVDHDHETGEVRGLLCCNCNWALGHLKDDPDLISKAYWYLVGEEDA
jgi:hypothetical protein